MNRVLGKMLGQITLYKNNCVGSKGHNYVLYQNSF